MKRTHILIGVTGGIAAFKALELIKQLVDTHLEVRVILTKNALNFVHPTDIEKITGHKPFIELFTNSFDYKKNLSLRSVEHIDLTDSARLFVIIPATANCIAKLACGIADDYLTTSALAATSPIMICPAMNVHMWNNPITQRNVNILQNQGIQFVGPDVGLLACGYTGAGRLMDTDTIYDEIVNRLKITESLKGRKVIVTSGGTIEPIDDIRFITNRSSGKMGAAMAESFFQRGADVLLLRSINSVKPRFLIPEELFDTAERLESLLKKYVSEYDVCVHAAAVSDYSLKATKGKISSNERLSLELEPKTKIVEKIKRFNPNIFLVGFKAEWSLKKGELVARAKEKMKTAQCDMIVANDVGKSGQGFESDDNEVFIIESSGLVTHVPKMNKRLIAEKVTDAIQKQL